MTQLNLLDKDAVTNFLNTVCPDVIIHCAAERFPDRVENDPQAAYDLNVGVSDYLADVASKFSKSFYYDILHIIIPMNKS